MKKVLVLFMVLVLFSGCQKKEDVLKGGESVEGDISYICYYETEYDNHYHKVEFRMTVSGDYSKMLKYEVYGEESYKTEEAADDAEEWVIRYKEELDNDPNADSKIHSIKREGNVLSYTRDWTPDEDDSQYSKEELDERIAWYEGEGAVCELQK
jgi:hypothetical protein